MEQMLWQRNGTSVPYAAHGSSEYETSGRGQASP